MTFVALDQRNFRDYLYEQVPPEWLPDLELAPNAAAVLDMLASTWSSHRVIERTVQVDSSGSTIFVEGSFIFPVNTTVNGDGIVSNPFVVRSTSTTINGLPAQSVVLSSPQTVPAGTRILFGLPDDQANGLNEFLLYVADQSRLQTSSGLFLDLFGQDFFGSTLQRHIDEPDESYRHRLLVNVLAPRVTRCSVFCGLENLTGFQPTIIEPRNTQDCGSYTSLVNPAWTGLAYNDVGNYGSMLLPFEFFVKATRPHGEGIPFVNGYGMSSGGYSTVPLPFGWIGSGFPPNAGTSEYVNLADLNNNRAVTDADIYKMVADCEAAGVTGWVNISSDIESEIRSSGLLDINFYLDLTTLTDNAALGVTGHIQALATLPRIRATSAFATSAVGLGTIRIAAAAVFGSSVNLSGTASLPTLHAAGGMDTALFSGSVTAINIQASGQMTKSVAASALVTLQGIRATGGMNTGVIAGSVNAISMQAAGQMVQGIVGSGVVTIPGLRATGAINISLAASGLANIQGIRATGGMNATVAGGAVNAISIQAAGQLLQGGTALGLISLPSLSASIVVDQTINAATQSRLALPAIAVSAFAQGSTGAQMPALGMFAYIQNGTALINYVSVNYTVGTSLLIPPGGRLAQTLLLGTSKIGIDYGY